MSAPAVDPPPPWALPGLLRGLTAGHPSLRAQVLRLLGRFPAADLEREPTRAVFEVALRERTTWAKGVGALVARRGLASYAPLLVDLLRHAELREHAEGWLRERTLVRPIDALIALTCDEEAPREGRLAALRLLKKQPLLDPTPLLVALAVTELQSAVIDVLRPACDSVLVDRAIAANQAHGEALLAKRRTRERGSPQPTFFERLLGPKVDELGVVDEQHGVQRTFTAGVARLAAVAGDARLALFSDWVVHPEVGEVLRAAWRKHSVSAVVASLVKRDASTWTRTDRATIAALVGDLAPAGDKKARKWLKTLLPEVGRPAQAEERAAIVALGKLGDQGTLQPLLDAAQSGLTKALGGGRERGGHPTTFDPCLRAAGHLKLAAFSDVALDSLRSSEVAEQLPSLPEVLAQLKPLELTPTLETALNTRPRRRTPWRLALETVRRTAQRELLKLAADTAAGDDDLVGNALAELISPKLLDLAANVIARLSDAPCDTLLKRAHEELGPKASLRLAQVVLSEGAGGAKAQRRALDLTVSQGGDVLEACAALFGADDMGVRTAVLKVAIEGGLFTRAEPLPEAVAYDLLLLVRTALAAPNDLRAVAQLRVLLDVLLPAAGQPGLGAEATEVLRTRIRECGLWREAASFHALHRDLLALGDQGLRVGLIHGALLSLLGTCSFRHPLTGVSGAYPGPLPRYPAAVAATRDGEQRSPDDARWVEEGLFDVVIGPGYLRPPSVVVGFLEASSARVRARALELLDRPAVLAHADAVLGRLDDASPAVRRTVVELLRRHELARFAPELTPALRDPDEAVQLSAARALAAWGERESLGHLVGFLDSPDPERRREAVTCLRGFAPDDLIGALAPMAGLGRPRATAGVLASLRPGRLPNDPELHARLFEVAARGTGPLRAAALRLLPDLVGGRLREVVPLLRDAHPAVRQAAAAVLRRPAGRKLAGSIAELAVAAEGPRLRLELLGLLSDLDQPEAARGVVPLLLDDDPRVRGEVRAALGAQRGYSIGPELVSTLERGLDGQGGPQAIAELVGLLDAHVEEEEPFVAALGCEERPVWEAALQALRRRGSTAHHERMVHLLGESLAPALTTLAIGEVEALPEAGEPLYQLASKGASPTVRRKALRALALHAVPGDKVVTQLLSEAEERARNQLKVHAADAKHERTLRGGRSKKRPPYELVQARSTLGTCGRLRLRHSVRLRELGPAASALHEAVWRTNSTLRGELHARAAKLVAVNPPRELGSVGLPPGISLADVAWLARDRVSPDRFLGWLAELGLERVEGDPGYARVRAVLAGLRAGVVTRLLAAQAVDTSTKGPLAKSLSISRYMPSTWERFLLAAAEHWSPGMSELLTAMVQNAGREMSGLPKRGYAIRRREERFTHYARAALRLEQHVQTKAFLSLSDNPALLGRLHAAQGNVTDLLGALEQAHGEELADARAEVVTLLGEVGSSQAREAIPAEAASSSRTVRAATARALGLAGDADLARKPLAALLGDGEAAVLEEALIAVGLLGDPAHVGAVRVHLGSDKDDVALAACRAARSLPEGHDLRAELIALVARGRDLVAPRTDAALAAHRWPALAAGLSLAPAVKSRLLLFREALETLAEYGPLDDADLRAKLLEACRGRQQPDPTLEALLVSAIPDAALDEVGALLGDDAPGTVKLALGVLLTREHTPAYEAIGALLQDSRPALREAACDAAATLGGEQHLARLQALHEDAEEQPGVRAAALRALAVLLPDRERALALVKAGALGEGTAAALRDAARASIPHTGADSELARWLLAEISTGLFRRFALPDAGLDADAAEREFTQALRRASVRHTNDATRAVTTGCFRALLSLGEGAAERGWALRMVQRAVNDSFRGPALLEVLTPWLETLEHDAQLAWFKAYAAQGPRYAAPAAERLLPFEPAVAARLLPQPRTHYGRRTDRQERTRALSVALAASHDPQGWGGAAREFLFAADSEVRVLARAALGDPRWEASS